MPDAFTHVALPSLFYKYIKPPFILPIVLIGTVVPDYFRQLTIFMIPVKYYDAIIPIHSILGALLISLLLSSFFIKKIRCTLFLSFFAGQILHLVFDMMQGFLGGGRLYLFFPYCKSIELGLFSETYWPYIFYFSLTVFVMYWLIIFFRK